jgi:tight adherence protein C
VNVLGAAVLAVAGAVLFAAGCVGLASGGPRRTLRASVPRAALPASWVSRRRRPVLIGAGCIVALPLVAFLPPPVTVAAGLVVVAAVRVRPIVEARARTRRKAAIDAEIPQMLDLLAAGSSAGLAAPLALRRAAEALRGPLADEIRHATEAVDLGARWREELRELSDRLDLTDMRRAVAVLTRTETLGSSLEDATTELAATVRQTRRAAVTERARAAPVKMLFPLVFLVLPAFLLLTVVPVLLTTVQSIR